MLERAAAIEKLAHHPPLGDVGRAAKYDERDIRSLPWLGRGQLRGQRELPSPRAASWANWLFKRLSA